jgi:hypothetical protein
LKKETASTLGGCLYLLSGSLVSGLVTVAGIAFWVWVTFWVIKKYA